MRPQEELQAQAESCSGEISDLTTHRRTYYSVHD